MSFPIYVINMKSALKRWELVQASGKNANLNLIRVDAVDGNSIPKYEWVDINEKEFILNTARNIFPGEYGCYRSHMLALEMFVASEEDHGIILEDDILLDVAIIERVKDIVTAADGFDVVKLVNHRAQGFITLACTPNGDSIGRTLFGPQGSAAAYLVSKAGAELLLKSLRTMSLPWDVALEKYWKIGANVLTIKDDILEFSEERSSSNIAPNGYGKKNAFSSYLLRGLYIAPDFFRRFHYAALGPRKQMHQAKEHPIDLAPSKVAIIIAGLSVLVMLSVFWLETDAYRWACLALVIPSLYFYLKCGFWRYDKPLIGFAGIICNFWAYYVLARFLHDSFFYPEKGIGSAEGIYLFPLIYPLLGYAMWRFCRKPFPIIVSFFSISIVALVISTDYSSIAAGVRATTFAHNNTIHAANAAGFLFIFAMCFAFHNLFANYLLNRTKIVAVCTSIILCVIAMVNVIELTSKGVWLALATTLPLMFICFVFSGGRTASRNITFRSVILLFFALFSSSIIYYYSEKIFIVGLDSYGTTLVFLDNLMDGKGLALSIENTLVSSDLSASAKPRLQMWLDVLMIWSETPIFGAGVGWEHAWDERTYSKHLSFNVFHNGFLEIGIRYGILGLTFFGFIFLWATHKVYMAKKYQLIAGEAAICYYASVLFFLLSNLSNSTVRLAIGESFMLLTIGFGFYCSFLLQEEGIDRPRSWF